VALFTNWRQWSSIAMRAFRWNLFHRAAAMPLHKNNRAEPRHIATEKADAHLRRWLGLFPSASERGRRI
jgi:hypothetical protein